MKTTARRVWVATSTVAALALVLSVDNAGDYRQYALKNTGALLLLLAGLAPCCSFTRPQIQRATQRARNNHPTNHKKGKQPMKKETPYRTIYYNENNQEISRHYYETEQEQETTTFHRMGDQTGSGIIAAAALQTLDTQTGKYSTTSEMES